MNATQKVFEDYHLQLLKPRQSLAKEVSIAPESTHEWDLTDREIDILSLMADGLTADMVADVLHISPHTVKTHQRNMLKKSGCANGIHLVAQSMREGLIT